MSSPPSSTAAECSYTSEERRLLIEVAHRAIVTALEGKKLDLTPPTPHLAEPRGAFTTLHLHGQLRGCVGYILAAQPLYRTVAETAQAAAFQDYRFPPVTRQEAEGLKIEISVMSVPAPILADEVEIGKHGLIVSWGNRRGLLLPQVPVEHGWSRGTFLEQTCVKAGLAEDAWRCGATLQGFTAEVFGE